MSAPTIPYPQSPTDVPNGLTDYADSYTRQQNLLLAGLFVFLIFYIAMVILFAMVGVWCFLTFAKWPVLKVVGMVLCGTFFLYLVKGFFKRPVVNKEMHIEITEEEHPILFGFIYQLCNELGAPKPNKVFVGPDGITGIMPRTTLLNLFVEPRKDLLIGLGLVNCVNLSEFKAVLAHEFGHFSQSALASSYTYVAHRIIFDLVGGEDWFDRMVDALRRTSKSLKQEGGIRAAVGSIGAGVASTVSAMLAVGREPLWWILTVITLQSRAVAREREFHADLVAVSVAGSDAVTHGLLQARFGKQCFVQAIDDLATALEHKKLHSNDVYLHQDRSSAVVRRKHKDPHLGHAPVLPHPTAGKTIRVFNVAQEELEDDTPPLWRTHPSNAEREENAKRTFVPAVQDRRSPWILFTQPDKLKERMTHNIYRVYFGIPKHSVLVDAVKVQEYIDNEHADSTYDPKYNGAYSDRSLEPGDLAELNRAIDESPWTEERMEQEYGELYQGCRERALAHASLHKKLSSLQTREVVRPSPRVKQRIEEIEAQLHAIREWFQSFDRRVYLLHVQMAGENGEWKNELIERYRFQMEIQQWYQETRKNKELAFVYYKTVSSLSPGEVRAALQDEMMRILHKSWQSLDNILQDAREINLPAMKNFEEGERLADFILPGPIVPAPPLRYVKGNWCENLLAQLGSVQSRCFRLHFKSVGRILAVQEKIAAAWRAARAPVAVEANEAAKPEQRPVVPVIVAESC